MKLICPDRYGNRQRLDLATLQHSKDFSNLDRKVQHLINIVSQTPKNFEELRDLILDENERIKEDISSGFREYERRQGEGEQHRRLLESLWFAEILVREETIAEAHKETFQWIFDRSARAVHPWSNFISWLEDGEGIYWISGKAGSGKSTLMNFLCQDKRTKEALEMWSGSKNVLMAQFFFWSAGTTMQKNFDGLLRSLLWQILKEFPDIDIFQSSIESGLEHKRRSTHYSQRSIGVWTKRRLHETLHEAIKKLQNSCYLCFFVDGLDEFDDDKDELIDFLQNIASNTGVKVCLSSRPDKEFEEAFGSSARLRLQDLTKEDIRQFVDDTFQKVPQLVLMASEKEYEMNQVKERIVGRAEGVFLWVSLAVKDQIRGLRNDDSPEQLQERFARLPNEIEGIYTRILDRVDKMYLREASLFLKMVLSERELSILELALASYPGLEDMLLSANEISEQHVVSLCRSTRNKLITRCGGLLEIHEYQNPEDPDQEDIERQTIGDRTSASSDEELEASSEVDMSAPTFQRETRDAFDRGNESRQHHREPDKRSPASSSKPRITDAEILDFEFETTVSFIHRTAADFLKNPGPGKAFLDANLSPGFDHQVQYLMVRLGGLRLIGESNLRGDEYWGSRMTNKTWSLNIDEIMPVVAKLEELSRMPQVRLCELIDRTMSNLDRRYPDWSSDSHWSTRWGRLAGMITLSGLSTNVDNSGATQTDPRTFLGFAASYNLSLYVNHVLDCREKKVGSEELDELLCCNVFGHGQDLFGRRPLILVPGLLSRGANPNARLMADTIWENFLGGLAKAWENSVRFGVSSLGFEETGALATIAFIEHSADLGTIWSGTIHFHSFRALGKGRLMEKCSFNLQASAPFIIELIMRNDPEMPRISSMCDARGAVRYSRCKSISFDLRQRTEKNESLAKRFNLSEQESKDFVEILELWSLDNEYQTLLSRVSEFYTRLDQNRAGASSPSSMDTSDTYESFEGSETRSYKDLSPSDSDPGYNFAV